MVPVPNYSYFIKARVDRLPVSQCHLSLARGNVTQLFNEFGWKRQVTVEPGIDNHFPAPPMAPDVQNRNGHDRFQTMIDKTDNHNLPPYRPPIFTAAG